MENALYTHHGDYNKEEAGTVHKRPTLELGIQEPALIRLQSTGQGPGQGSLTLLYAGLEKRATGLAKAVTQESAMTTGRQPIQCENN